jgi:2-hydroxychromene-2-carboxylate isomerase
MGDVISLERHRQARRRRASSTPPQRRAAMLYFDLSSPFTYLAAERADHLFAGLRWRPAYGVALHRGDPLDETGRLEAAERAELLRLPLVWPEREPAGTPAAMRVASLAVESGRGAAFVLAASRLAYCGGYDIEEPEVLAEAAAAAGLGLRECLDAAGDTGRDGLMEETGRRLLAAGADRLPVLRIGRMLFCGEDRLSEAAAASRWAV